jgi:tetratricopeptide (TPR) repeat protein
MERVRDDAHDAGDRRIEGRALIALGKVSAFRDADDARAQTLIEEGLALLEPDDFIGRFDALRQLATVARWRANYEGARVYAEQAFEASRESERPDLMSWAAIELAGSYLSRFELDRADELATEALRLAEESGGIVTRGQALHILGDIADQRREPEQAIGLYERAIALFAEAGAALDQARSLNHLAETIMDTGDFPRAERHLREAMRMLMPLGDRAYLCESQRILAENLVRQGRLEEAERQALAAMETVGPNDVTSLATTRMALGLVRGAQGRDAEAEELLRSALQVASDPAPGWIHTAVVGHFAEWLRERGRVDEAAELEAELRAPTGVG